VTHHFSPWGWGTPSGSRLHLVQLSHCAQRPACSSGASTVAGSTCTGGQEGLEPGHLEAPGQEDLAPGRGRNAPSAEVSEGHRSS